MCVIFDCNWSVFSLGIALSVDAFSLTFGPLFFQLYWGPENELDIEFTPEGLENKPGDKE